jgi:hypothetical protein
MDQGIVAVSVRRFNMSADADAAMAQTMKVATTP